MLHDILKEKVSLIPTHLSENCPLLKVDKFKYLGVTLTSDINWANHACSYNYIPFATRLIGIIMFYYTFFPAAEKLH